MTDFENEPEKIPEEIKSAEFSEILRQLFTRVAYCTATHGWTSEEALKMSVFDFARWYEAAVFLRNAERSDLERAMFGCDRERFRCARSSSEPFGRYRINFSDTNFR